MKNTRIVRVRIIRVGSPNLQGPKSKIVLLKPDSNDSFILMGLFTLGALYLYSNYHGIPFALKNQLVWHNLQKNIIAISKTLIPHEIPIENSSHLPGCK